MLINLLMAFNFGDVQTYEKMRPQWTQQPDLNSNQDANDKQIIFHDMAHHTGLDVSKIELFAMKALSKTLFKAQIDQVGENVNLN